MPKENVGKVIQIIGPVLDIKFDCSSLPNLLNAIEIKNNNDIIIVEVAHRRRYSPMYSDEFYRRIEKGNRCIRYRKSN